MKYTKKMLMAMAMVLSSGVSFAAATGLPALEGANPAVEQSLTKEDPNSWNYKVKALVAASRIATVGAVMKAGHVANYANPMAYKTTTGKVAVGGIEASVVTGLLYLAYKYGVYGKMVQVVKNNPKVSIPAAVVAGLALEEAFVGLGRKVVQAGKARYEAYAIAKQAAEKSALDKEMYAAEVQRLKASYAIFDVNGTIYISASYKDLDVNLVKTLLQAAKCEVINLSLDYDNSNINNLLAQAQVELTKAETASTVVTTTTETVK